MRLHPEDLDLGPCPTCGSHVSQVDGLGPELQGFRLGDGSVQAVSFGTVAKPCGHPVTVVAAPTLGSSIMRIKLVRPPLDVFLERETAAQELLDMARSLAER